MLVLYHGLMVRGYYASLRLDCSGMRDLEFTPDAAKMACRSPNTYLVLLDMQLNPAKSAQLPDFPIDRPGPRKFSENSFDYVHFVTQFAAGAC